MVPVNQEHPNLLAVPKKAAVSRGEMKGVGKKNKERRRLGRTKNPPLVT